MENNAQGRLGAEVRLSGLRAARGRGTELFGELVECPTCGKLMQVPDLKNAPGDIPPKRLPAARRKAP